MKEGEDGDAACDEGGDYNVLCIFPAHGILIGGLPGENSSNNGLPHGFLSFGKCSHSMRTIL